MSGHDLGGPDAELSISDIGDLERRRIGREIQEGLAEQLMALSVAAGALTEALEERGAPEAAEAQRLLSAVDDAAGRARLLSYLLSSPNLAKQGLAGALDELMTRVRDSTPLSTTVHVDSWEPLDDPDKAIHVYRIVQEAVSNALKHSGGTHVDLRLSGVGGRREVRIADDGEGPSPEASALVGIGLSLMRQRAELLGGQLELVERPTKGTAVRLTFPD